MTENRLIKWIKTAPLTVDKLVQMEKYLRKKHIIRPWLCRKCKKEFYRQKVLGVFLSAPSRDRRFTCDDCRKRKDAGK